MPISPDEISGKTFLTTVRGYDRAEVDSYLRAVAADQDRLLRRIEQLEAAAGSLRPSRNENPVDHKLVALLDEAVERVASSKERLASIRTRLSASEEEAAPNVD